MMDQMPPEQRAKADAAGPKNQAITWALSPLGVLLQDLLMALILWPTINFGFGGKATFGSLFVVTVYAGLVLWPIRLILGGISLFAGASPDGFNVGNPAPTNIAAFLNPADTSKALYTLLSAHRCAHHLVSRRNVDWSIDRCRREAPLGLHRRLRLVDTRHAGVHRICRDLKQKMFVSAKSNGAHLAMCAV